MNSVIWVFDVIFLSGSFEKLLLGINTKMKTLANIIKAGKLISGRLDPLPLPGLMGLQKFRIILWCHCSLKADPFKSIWWTSLSHILLAFFSVPRKWNFSLFILKTELELLYLPAVFLEEHNFSVQFTIPLYSRKSNYPAWVHTIVVCHCFSAARGRLSLLCDSSWKG